MSRSPKAATTPARFAPFRKCGGRLPFAPGRIDLREAEQLAGGRRSKEFVLISQDSTQLRRLDLGIKEA